MNLAALITQTDCSSVLIEVGGLAVRVRADDAEFLRLLEIHYAGFLSSDQQPEADFDVEIRGRNFDDTEPDVNVTTRNGRWELTRGDFRAEWEPAKRHGHIVQMANPYGIDSVLRIVHSLIQADRGGFLLHSASAVRNGKAFLFAGESGAGKTTISRLAPADAELLTDEISYVRRQGVLTSRLELRSPGNWASLGRTFRRRWRHCIFWPKVRRIVLIRSNRVKRRGLYLPMCCSSRRMNIWCGRLFDSGFEFVKRVPVSRLTFVPDARVWELIG